MRRRENFTLRQFEAQRMEETERYWDGLYDSEDTETDNNSEPEENDDEPPLAL